MSASLLGYRISFPWMEIWKLRPKIELERPIPLNLLKPFLISATLTTLSVWLLFEKETLSMKLTGPIKILEFVRDLLPPRNTNRPKGYFCNITLALIFYTYLYLFAFLCILIRKIVWRIEYNSTYLLLLLKSFSVFGVFAGKALEIDSKIFDYSDKRSVFYATFLLHNLVATNILNSVQPLPLFINQMSKLYSLIAIAVAIVNMGPFLIITLFLMTAGLFQIGIGPVDSSFPAHMDKYILWNPIKEKEIPKFLEGHGKNLYFCSKLDQPFAVIHTGRLHQISVLFACVAQTRRIETMFLALLGVVFGQITKIKIHDVTLCKTNVSMLIGLAIYILDEYLRNFLEINPFLALFYLILTIYVLHLFTHCMVRNNRNAYPETNRDLPEFLQKVELLSDGKQVQKEEKQTLMDVD